MNDHVHRWCAVMVTSKRWWAGFMLLQQLFWVQVGSAQELDAKKISEEQITLLRMQEEIESLDKQLSEEEGQLKERSGRRQELQKELEKLVADSEAVQKKYEELRAQAPDTPEAKEKRAEAIRALGGEFEITRASVQVLKAKLNNINQQTTGAKNVTSSSAVAANSALNSELQVARDEADSLKAIKLMQWGVTVGAAVSMQIPTSQDNALREAVAVPMGYLAVFPSYWTGSAEINRYCASSWTLEEDESQLAAVAIARKWARRVVKDSLHHVNLGIPAEKVADMWRELIHADNAGLLQAAERLKAGAGDPKVEAAVVEYLASLRWDPGERYRCGWKKFGLWFGKPASFDARPNERKTPEAGAGGAPVSPVAFKPDFAFGAAFSPNAYLTVLAGVTYGRFNSLEYPGRQSEDEFLWNVALGGNIDFLLRFFR